TSALLKMVFPEADQPVANSDTFATTAPSSKVHTIRHHIYPSAIFTPCEYVASATPADATWLSRFVFVGRGILLPVPTRQKEYTSPSLLAFKRFNPISVIRFFGPRIVLLTLPSRS